MLMDPKFLKRVTRYQRRRAARLRAATFCVRRSLYTRAVYSIQTEPWALSGLEDGRATLEELRQHEVGHDVQVARERRVDEYKCLWETQEVQGELVVRCEQAQGVAGTEFQDPYGAALRDEAVKPY